MAIKQKVLSVALAGIILVPSVATANAGPKRNTYITNNYTTVTQVTKVNKKHHHKHRKHRRNGISPAGAAAIGILGVATGALLASNAQARYYQPAPPPAYTPQPVAVVAPPPVYQQLQPWSSQWYSYCASKYRSFNASTGTYTTYSGVQKFCQ
ncbi:BA14K family protein [Flexibacterium corallicola]|uniref:BA14K family protein n=1 Tax=Flexibacterium corallicola TaxID=3037259 RepID=UPI00286F7334|nr:BA14K family protein [Pseudovibrio sp. M1P-2-3]